MSVPREDDADRPDPTSTRRGELRLDNGELVIYDTEESTAWIHTDCCNDLPVVVCGVGDDR